MGQITKPVCFCPCVRLRALSRWHFLMDFPQNWHRRKNKSENEFVGGKHRTWRKGWCDVYPHFAPKPPILDEEVLKLQSNINNNTITALNVRESPKFPRLT